MSSAQRRRVGPGVRVVTGDDQAARVGHAPAHLGQPPVRGLQDPLHPFALRVQRGPPGLRELFGEHGRAQRSGDLVTGPGPPAHLTGVGQEDDRPDHAVVQGLPVAVDVIGHAAPAAVGIRRVGHERDRVGITAERGAGERQPAPGGLERLTDRFTPGHGVTGVVDLVEDHQRAPVHRALPVQDRVRGNLGVGHRHPGEVGGGPALRVAVGGVEGDPGVVRGLRPLVLEMLGGRDHGDRGDLPAGQQLGGDGQRPGCLACSWGGDEQEIAPGQAEILPVGFLLPGPQGQEQIGPDRSVRAAAILMGCGRGGAHEAERLPAGPGRPGQPAPRRAWCGAPHHGACLVAGRLGLRGLPAAGPAGASAPRPGAAVPPRRAPGAAGTRSGRWCCAARQRPTWPGRRARPDRAGAACPCVRSPDPTPIRHDTPVTGTANQC